VVQYLGANVAKRIGSAIIRRPIVKPQSVTSTSPGPQ
jgi:hypothetical protein